MQGTNARKFYSKLHCMAWSSDLHDTKWVHSWLNSCIKRIVHGTYTVFVASSSLYGTWTLWDSSWGFPPASRFRPPFSVFTILTWPGSTAGKKIQTSKLIHIRMWFSDRDGDAKCMSTYISTYLVDQGHVVGLHLLHVDPDVALAVQVILAATARKKDRERQLLIILVYIYKVSISRRYQVSICNRLIWWCLSYLNTCSHLRFSLSSSFIRCM